MPYHPRKEKYYSVKLLQKVLDLLWKFANKDGYVLSAPSLVLGTKSRKTFPVTKSETVTMTLPDLTGIYSIFEKIGVATLHTYNATQTTITIIQLTDKKVDPDKHAAVYEEHEVVQLQSKVSKLERQLAETRAELERRGGELSTPKPTSAESPDPG